MPVTWLTSPTKHQFKLNTLITSSFSTPDQSVLQHKNNARVVFLVLRFTEQNKEVNVTNDAYETTCWLFESQVCFVS